MEAWCWASTEEVAVALGHLAPAVLPALMDHRVPQGLMDQRVHQELMDLQAPQGLMDLQAPQGLMVSTGHLAQTESMALRVSMVQTESTVPRDQRDPRVPSASLDPQGLLGQMERTAPTGHLDH